MNLQDMKDKLAVRAVLEGLAAREAHGKLSPEDLREMGAAVKRMETAVWAQDGQGYFQAHKRFHEIFINGSGNLLLINLLNAPQMDRDWFPALPDRLIMDLAQALEMHQRIWGMFQDPASSPQELARLVREHMGAGRESLSVFVGGKEIPNHKGYALQ